MIFKYKKKNTTKLRQDLFLPKLLIKDRLSAFPVLFFVFCFTSLPVLEDFPVSIVVRKGIFAVPGVNYCCPNSVIKTAAYLSRIHAHNQVKTVCV